MGGRTHKTQGAGRTLRGRCPVLLPCLVCPISLEVSLESEVALNA